MDRKELTKTIRMHLNWKDPLVSMENTEVFQRLKGWEHNLIIDLLLIMTFALMSGGN